MAAKDDRLAAENDRLAVDVDGLATNQADVGPRNQLNTDLIMTTTSDIRVDPIKNFNNGALVVVSDKLSRIVTDKYAIDYSAWILVNIINNLFADLSPFSMALLSFPFLSSLLASTTGNFGNILTATFIYYMLISMPDLVLS